MSATTKWAPFPLALAILACGAEPPPGSPATPAATTDHQDLIFIGGYTNSAIPLTPEGMNDSGAMAGVTPSGAPALYNAGTLTQLGVLPASAGCIRYGQLRPTTTNGVVGTCDTATGSHPVFWFFLFWGPGQLPLQLGSLSITSATVGGSTPGYSMVGSAASPSLWGHAYRWSGPGAASLTDIQPISVGWWGNWTYSSNAVSVNDAGYAVGTASTGVDTYPIVWNPSNGVTVLQQLSGYGYQTWPTVVKNSGYIAGRSGVDATGNYAVIWRLDGSIASYINIPGLVSVDGLSAQNRLVGTAFNGGRLRAWTSINGAAPSWLDPPAGAYYLKPVGVSSCGAIAAQVIWPGAPATGVVVSKLFCDNPVVVAL